MHRSVKYTMRRTHMQRIDNYGVALHRRDASRSSGISWLHQAAGQVCGETYQ